MTAREAAAVAAALERVTRERDEARDTLDGLYGEVAHLRRQAGYLKEAVDAERSTWTSALARTRRIATGLALELQARQVAMDVVDANRRLTNG